jgi:dihydroorotate dehydrogenase (fumarate)
MPDVSTTYMGLSLKSPLIASSSGLTNSVNDIKSLAENGAGAIVLKSLFEEEIITELEREMHKMHSENYLYPETMDYYEDYNVEDTLTSYLKLVHDCKKEVDVPIIASINCITPYNWTYFAKSLQDAGADAIELNIFTLPSDIEKKGNEHEQLYFDVLKAIKKEVSIPVALKISPYFSNLAALIQDLSQQGADGIVLFNRYYSPDIDIENLEVVSANLFSEAIDYIQPLRWIAITSGRVDCDISASTGVHDGKALIKMLLAGAQTVQVASTLYKNGFDQMLRMLDDLSKWMARKNFDTLDQFRGMLSQKDVSNPAGFLRVQFMKHFSEK